ncbi:homoserine O-acetyltransferase [Annulohypoxylon maeteangense]|uniref:homoserine O-acetyltransferase n=1 Tax=Annulohypoxylon maeteangense TaxID=1927788 RepID=UPI002007BE7D|nr:homoserine O-acetyltransferase [Annulohypoxylon maeteangense]KAI0887242.1 homoserine O-acetyltransferase [Annulohypoxylon maeteangense]
MATLLDHNPNPDNYYATLIQGQKFAVIPELVLDSGEVLESCPIAYKTWGRLNEARDNVLVICHALTGSSDISDWWSPLLGRGKAFDPAHFFIFCANVLGSPYGSASPLTVDPRTGRQYASEFPQTTVRDDVRAHKHVLDALGVRSVAAVIGGSMGGMTTLEWPLCTAPGFVRSILPIATAADHSAWGISWAEAQRQCIYSDPRFDDGYYTPRPEGQPSAGLAAARMVAMLTYRSCMSFDERFGRKPPRQQQQKPRAVTEPPLDLPRTEVPTADTVPGDAREHRKGWAARRDPSFSAQGYLHYQGQKFIQRFDANCYLHITNKMDAHDVTLGRTPTPVSNHDDTALREVLAAVPAGALVVSVETDALFLPEQQERLANCLPEATLAMLRSSDGHDGFLLEFEQLTTLIVGKLRKDFPQYYSSAAFDDSVDEHTAQPGGASLTGEVEAW